MGTPVAVLGAALVVWLALLRGLVVTLTSWNRISGVGNVKGRVACQFARAPSCGWDLA